MTRIRDIREDDRHASPESHRHENHVSVKVDVHEFRDIGKEERARKGRSKPDLLASARTSRRALRRVAGLSRLSLPVPLDAVTRLLRVVMRRYLLMCRVCMILGLEVLGLVWGTFAIPGHEFSKFESISEL